MRRAGRWFTFTLLFVLVVLVVTLGFLTSTQHGSRWFIEQIASRSNDTLSFGQITGKLSSPLQLYDISIKNESARTHIGHLRLKWSPRALLARRVSVQYLDIRDVSVTLVQNPDKPERESQQPFPTKIELPFEFDLESISLSNFRLFYSADSEPIVIDDAQAGLRADAQGVRLNALNVRGDLVELKGQLALDSEREGAIEGELRWQLRPNGLEPLNGVTKLGGQLQRPEIDTSLSEPYSGRATVNIDLSQQPPEIMATLKTQTIAVHSISKGLPPVPVSIDARVTGTAGELAVQTDAEVLATSDIRVDIELAAFLNNDRFDIENLKFSSADIDAVVSGSGWVRTQPELEVDLGIEMVDFVWPLQDKPLVEIPQGTINIRGPQAALEIASRLTVAAEPNMTVRADGMVNALAEPDVDVVLSWVDARWPPKGDALVQSAEGRFKTVGGIHSANITGAARLGAQGKVTAEATRLDGELKTTFEWTNLGWPLVETAATPPVLTSPTGSLTLDGDIDNYRLTINSRLEALTQQTDLNLKGTGNATSFDFSTLRLTGDAGDVDAEGSVAWSSPWKIDVRLDGDQVNPGALLSEWPGELQISVDASATASDSRSSNNELNVLNALNAKIDRLSVEGSLRDYPVSVDASGSLRDGLVTIDTAKLSSGRTVANINGRIDETLNLEWQLDSPSLKELLPEAHGELRSQGRIGGSIDKPVVSASLKGKQLQYLKHAVDSIDIEADWFGDGEQQSSFTVAASDSVIAGVEASEITFSANGSPLQHQAQLLVDTRQGGLSASLSGGLGNAVSTDAPGSWLGSVESLKFYYAELAPWQLTSPISMAASRDTVSIEKGCFESSQAELCLSGVISKSTIDANISLQELPFSYLNSYLPETMTVNGSVSSEVQLTRDSAGQLSVDTVVNTSPGSYEISVSDDSNAETTAFNFEPGTVSANLRENRLSSRGELRLNDADAVSFNIAIDNLIGESDGAELSGNLDGSIEDLGIFGSFTDQVTDLRGNVVASVDVAGTLAEPKLLGELTLSDGGVAVPVVGVDVTQLQAKFSGEPGGQIGMEANALVGEGDAKLSANLALIEGIVKGKINLVGDNLAVFQTDDANVWIDPDLEITLGDRVLDVKGKVHVPRAAINPVALSDAAISVSGDQVFVETEDSQAAESEDSRPPVSVQAEVGITLGDNVEIDAFGLRGRVEGRLDVNESQQQPTSATGELRIIDGRYDAYGQTLAIERGRIIFAGGRIEKPGIDVRALRRPTDDITVGVSALGTLEQPDFSLFSEPAMTQRDQLSWLLLGQASDDLGQSESSAISQAETALGLKGASYLADRIGKQFGVDTFKVETEAGGGTNTAALMIGKYLSPKLYVSYGLGLFGSTSTLRTQYTLSKNWRISTESSKEGAGGDFIYSIESGK